MSALTKRLHVPFDKIFQQAPVPAKSIKSFSEEEGQPVLRAKRWQLTGREAHSEMRYNVYSIKITRFMPLQIQEV